MTFEDVSDDSCRNYVAWAAANGIVTGRNSKAFDPDGAITREELALMLYRYVKFAKLQLNEAAGTVPFADIDLVGSGAREAVLYMQRIGLFTGRTGNTFDPKATATRAEVASVFARLLGLIEK
jgi:hypothetical protein